MTILAVLTPTGPSALATLALSGDRAWSAIRSHFVPEMSNPPEAGSIYFGRLGRDVADEVVLTCRAAAPCPHFEIHCHGGREVVRFLVELFLDQGIEEVSWQEFLLRTQPHLKALAGIALAQATTPRVAGILLDQYRGAFERALREVEASPEKLRQLARWSSPGRKLLSGFRVVLAGPPNVGKSSLVNAIAGYPRSIVSALPGTTRDVVSVRIALDGWPVELCDTAGLRTGADPLEQAGIERTQATLTDADLILWVVDGSVPNPETPQRADALVVVNKSDLPAAWSIPEGGLSVSATTGQGLDSLLTALVTRLVPEVPPPGTGLPFTPELVDAVEGMLALWQAHDTAGLTATLARYLMPLES